MARKSSAAPPFGLVLVRLTLGVVLLHRGWRWVQDESLGGGEVRRLVDAALAKSGAVAGWWGEDVLLMNPDAIAFLCRWLALLGGICFVVGALTRPLGVILAFFLINAWAYGAEDHRTLFLVLLASGLACAVSRAGHAFGLDAALEIHAPRWLTWSTKKRSFLD